MRYAHKNLIRSLLLLSILGLMHASYAENTHQENTIFRTLRQANMTGMVRWLIDGREANLFCVVTSSINQFNEPEDRLLFFEEQDGRRWKRNEEFIMDEHVMSLFLINALSSNSWHLVTYSLGTTYIMVHIFSLIDNTIQVVFEYSTRCAPEILDIDNDGFDEILLCNGTFATSGEDNSIVELPESASIYRWDGTQYALWKTVLWKERFCEGIQGNTHHETRE